MRWRMMCFSSASNASCAAWRYSPYSGASAGPEYFSSTSSSTALVAAWRSSLSVTEVAWSSASPCDSAISLIRSSLAFGTSISSLGLPALLCSSTCAAHSFLIAECAMSSASRISASGTSLAPHSTISTASSVPATTRSMSAVSSCSSVGLTTKLPSTLPIRTAPTAVGYGMSEIISAADAPFIARTSYGVDLVHGQREVDQLRLAPPALREERPQRAVDHAGDQRRLLAGAALALEERAGDLARGVHALLDIHRQREEVDVAEISCGGGGQHHGVARRDRHGAGGLLGHLAGLEGDLGPADLDGDPVHFRHMSLSRARLGSRRGPLHRLDASVVVDRHVSRRFRSERRRVAWAAMASRIVVFGATGYTGRLIAERLVAAGRAAGARRALGGARGRAGRARSAGSSGCAPT